MQIAFFLIYELLQYRETNLYSAHRYKLTSIFVFLFKRKCHRPKLNSAKDIPTYKISKKVRSNIIISYFSASKFVLLSHFRLSEAEIKKLK